MENFEELLRKDLHQFILSMKEVDERLPECPDVEEKWEAIAKAYIPDGIREFQDFPSASLGWMMNISIWQSLPFAVSTIASMASKRPPARIAQPIAMRPRSANRYAKSCAGQGQE